MSGIGRYSRPLPAVVSMGLVGLVVVACQEESPTGLGQVLPAQPTTIEVELPWSDFASNFAVFGGYGAPAELRQGVVATDFAGTLDARTLIRFGTYPNFASVIDSTGTLRSDTAITFIGGRVIAYLDTIASTNTGPVTFGLGAIQAEWDAGTTTWTAAVDTINDTQLWPQAGAGGVVDLGTAVWDPADGDSVLFAVDSATIAAWADTTDLSRGARLELVTTGERVQLRLAALRLDARPTIDPDTIVELSTGASETTFVYDPPPPAPSGGRIGGTPAWRTVLDVALPDSLTGPPSLCAVITCPHPLHQAEVSFAALVLTSSASDPAFQPTDSVDLDVRPVLLRSAMPKAPLGESYIEEILGKRIPAEAFGSQAGQRIEVPITPFIRALVSGDDGSGGVPPHSLALLAILEPRSITYASFVGPGGVGEPMLRLVLTIGPPVELP